jgi:hypothetical protein
MRGSERQTGADEIEVTEEMEAAGIRVLVQSRYLDQADPGFRLLPRLVFTEMWKCRPRSKLGCKA